MYIDFLKCFTLIFQEFFFSEIRLVLTRKCYITFEKGYMIHGKYGAMAQRRNGAKSRRGEGEKGRRGEPSYT
jgi:hypothetical protein